MARRLFDLAIMLVVLLAFLSSCTTAGAAMREPDIRVALLQGTSAVAFKVTGEYTISNTATGGTVGVPASGEQWEVRAHGTLLQVVRGGTPIGSFTGPLRVEQVSVRLAVAGPGGRVVEKSGTEGLIVLGAGNNMATLGRDPSAYQVLSPGGRKMALKSGQLNLIGIQLANGQWRRYRGNLEIRASDQGLLVINELPLEQYLLSVVPGEVPAQWPYEVLKAQAVAARSYALRQIWDGADKAFHVYPTEASQMYLGYDGENPATTRAVEETRGQTLVYAAPGTPSRGGLPGEPVAAFYHSSSGGYIENAEDVWLKPVPGIKGKQDPYDVNDNYYNWKVSYDISQLTDLINNWLFKQGAGWQFQTVTDIVELERTATGARIKKVRVEGRLPDGTERYYDIFNADNVRRAFGLKSAPFQLAKEVDAVGVPTRVTFTGSGNGHGVGMSQYGARGMAEQGHTYDQILQYYYTGTVLAPAYT
ncbi:MAG: SpoIID/LytB domain protein [Clostridia bacterium 62_21]|nr:MAG: SpoIID/LytB domain protein [Clostridia bacterium 62_21]HAG07897.1 stage II sporulation protein SpoIID [Peptococcaceae bacterium]